MRRFQASTHGRIFLLLIKKSNPKQEGTNMGRLTVLEQIAQDIAAEFGKRLRGRHPWSEDKRTGAFHYLYCKRTRNRTKCRWRSIGRSFRRHPPERTGKWLCSSRPQWLPDENSRRQDFEVQYFIYKGRWRQPSLCIGINYDITKLTLINSALDDLITPKNKEEKPKQITHSVNDLLDRLIEESVKLVGKPVALMNKEDKVTAIQFLNDSGAFLITKSGDKVANYFGISKYTLYSYIDVNK